MKILVIGLTSNFGGVETTMFNFFDRLKKTFDITFLNSSPKKLAIPENSDIKIKNITSFYKNKYKYKKELKKLYAEYDIIYWNVTSFKNMIPLKCKLNNQKLIIHVHNYRKNKLLNILKKRLICKKGDIFISCSLNASKSFFNKKIICSKKHYIIKNFIDVEKFQMDLKIRNDMRRQMNLNDNFVIGNVGKICKQKNQIFLIKVLNKIVKNHNSNIKLVLIGKEKDFVAGRKLIKKYHLEKYVIILKNCVNVEEYMMTFDCFAFPSLGEGFGNALVEAQLLGIPCISSCYVPNEANISKKVKFLNLKKQVWCNEILNIYINNQKPKKINIDYLNNESINKIKQILEECIENGKNNC